MVCEKPLAMTVGRSRPSWSRSGRGDRPHPRGQLQHPVLPAQPAPARPSPTASWVDVRLVTGRYFQDWLLLDTDWNWRLEPEDGGELRAVGDIGTHWLDLITFVTGQHVASVMAELATFIAPRHQPTGPVETFSTERAADTVERAMPPRTPRRSCSASTAGPGAPSSISQMSPGRKNSLEYEIDGSDGAWGWDCEQPDQPWIGHRDRPNEILLRNPALMSQRAGRGGLARRSRRGVLRHALRPLPGDLRGRAGRATLLLARLRDLRRRARRDARRRGDRTQRARRALGRCRPSRRTPCASRAGVAR